MYEFVFDKGAKNPCSIWCAWNSLLNKQCLNTWISMKKNETGPFPQAKYKINSKQITDLNRRAKLLEENTGIIFVTQSDNRFLNMTPRP